MWCTRCRCCCSKKQITQRRTNAYNTTRRRENREEEEVRCSHRLKLPRRPMHRLKRVMKALSSQIFQTTRNNQKRHDSKYQRAHVAHARRRRVSFLGIDSSRKKKARDSCQKKGTRENKILFSSLCSERVCLLRFLVIVRA